MLIAVTAKSADPNSEVEPRFGRAPYFQIIDTESDEIKVVENSENVNAMQGAGIQAAESLANTNADVLLTGHCGPKAFHTLKTAGIRIVVGVDGAVKEAVERFKNNEYEYAASPDVESHW
ncbi:MAG: dinitrogenase iron-molybdenum cofactor biosynthesis protein [candidate division Zixibacteria bacterium]|nr:dinitrogenase iron-molybdenum cofactor biosynthesis protein [candidate division Zixibacteria bacterium]